MKEEMVKDTPRSSAAKQRTQESVKGPHLGSFIILNTTGQ